MQALRHASRRALHATVVQETCVVSVRPYTSEAGSRAVSRKSKEERFELARQFVAKFKAANNGQIPGISLLRKEVGGKYEILKEVLQELEKCQDELGTLKQTVELKGVEDKTQESTAAAENGCKKQSLSKEKDSKKDKKVTPQVLKSSKAMESVNQADLRITSKDLGQMKESVVSVKNAFKSTMDTTRTTDEDNDDVSHVAAPYTPLVQLKQSSASLKDNFGSRRDTALTTDEEDADDSDVAAPEYHHTPLYHNISLLKTANLGQMEKGLKTAKVTVAHLKNDAKRQNENQAIKSKHADVKQLKLQDGGSKIELQHEGLGAENTMDDTTAKHPLPDGNFGSGTKGFGGQAPPLTTIARIINLPAHISASKLRSICESVGRVHKVDLRRGHIADVQFNVDIAEMNDILDRLRKTIIGSTRLRVFPALKYSGRINADSRFEPQDANQLKQVRNSLFSLLEQRFKFLFFQFEDYRELQAMKVAR